MLLTLRHVSCGVTGLLALRLSLVLTSSIIIRLPHSLCYSILSYREHYHSGPFLVSLLLGH